MQTRMKGRRSVYVSFTNDQTLPNRSNKAIDLPKEGMECIDASRGIIAVCREFAVWKLQTELLRFP